MIKEKQPPSTEQERIRLVKEIFSSIPRRYDFLNHFLSLRRDIAWRRKTSETMRFFNTNRFLDIATGTADLAIEAATMHPEIRVVGVDFVPEMIELGRKKTRERGLGNKVRLTLGDALHLPFEDNSFDVAAVAFGIRNMPDRVRALSEMARVVVDGGQVMVLELATPQNRIFKGIYGIYLNGILPFIGRFFSGNGGAYHYLAESIMEFPNPERFSSIMEEAGLKDVSRVPLSMGVAYLHTGLVSKASS